MTTTTLSPAEKAAATRAANREAAARKAIGKVKIKRGFHGYACQHCKAKAEIISANAVVGHRCPAKQSAFITFVYVGRGR